MAFVLILQWAPDPPSILPEGLSRFCPLPVLHITQDLPIEAGYLDLNPIPR